MVGSMMDSDRMATGGNRKMPQYGTYGGARREMVDAGRMMPTMPFFKQPDTFDPCYRPPGQMRTMNYTPMDKYCAEKRRAEQERSRPFMPQVGVRPSVGHPRFGFETLLNQGSVAPLPTAPAIVGGNVDWTKSKVTPATHYLHSVLSGGRPMNPPPALGTTLRLTEPTINSIHTHY